MMSAFATIMLLLWVTLAFCSKISPLSSLFSSPLVDIRGGNTKRGDAEPLSAIEVIVLEDDKGLVVRKAGRSGNGGASVEDYFIASVEEGDNKGNLTLSLVPSTASGKDKRKSQILSEAVSSMKKSKVESGGIGPTFLSPYA